MSAKYVNIVNANLEGTIVRISFLEAGNGFSTSTGAPEAQRAELVAQLAMSVETFRAMEGVFKQVEAQLPKIEQALMN